MRFIAALLLLAVLFLYTGQPTSPVADLSGKSVVILVANGFRSDHVRTIAYMLEKRGAEIVFSSGEAGTVYSGSGLVDQVYLSRYSPWPDHSTKTKGSDFIEIVEPVTELNVDYFHALLVTGDHQNSDELLAQQEVVQFIKSFADSGGLIGGSGAGTTLLGTCGILRGKHAAVALLRQPTFEIKGQSEQPIWGGVQDESLITTLGRGYDFDEFVIAVGDALRSLHSPRFVEAGIPSCHVHRF